MLNTILHYIFGLEFWGMVTGIWCVWLCRKESMWNWPIGIVNILIWMVMFYQAHLYGSFGIQIFFFILNCIGWYNWTQFKGRNNVRRTTLAKPWQVAVAFLIGLAGTFIVGKVLAVGTDAVAPFWDSWILSMSLVAQVWMNLKKLQNWYMWNTVDVVSVVLYASQGLYLTAFCYAVFIYICIRGYFEWKKEMEAQQNTISTCH
jgi:nicotinamide mononucleotide transporter